MDPQYTLTQASFGEAGTYNRPLQKCEFYLDKINFNLDGTIPRSLLRGEFIGKKQVTMEVDAVVYMGTKDEIIHKAFTNILLLVAGMVSSQEGNPGDMDRIYQELEKRYLSFHP
jgi:hypothetical protein